MYKKIGVVVGMLIGLVVIAFFTASVGATPSEVGNYCKTPTPTCVPPTPTPVLPTPTPVPPTPTPVPPTPTPVPPTPTPVPPTPTPVPPTPTPVPPTPVPTETPGPPCPNAELEKYVTRCEVPVAGVNVWLESSRGDRIPSLDQPMFTDSAGKVFFSRDMGITAGDGKEWQVYIDGVTVEVFEVLECEASIQLYNKLPCPPPELLEVKELPVTGISLGTDLVAGMAFAAILVAAGFLRRRH